MKCPRRGKSVKRGPLGNPRCRAPPGRRPRAARHDRGGLAVPAKTHDARPLLLNLDEPGGFEITSWAARVGLIDATYVGTWELPALGVVTAPTAVLIRPDGYMWPGWET